MIEVIVVVALAALFIHVTFWKGMIFEPISNKLKTLPEYIKKPLYDCPICSTPWHGSLILLIGNYTGTWEIINWFQWIIILFAAAGLNTFLIYVINQGKSVTKTLDNDFDCGCVKKETEEERAKERQERIKTKVTKAGKGYANDVFNIE